MNTGTLLCVKTLLLAGLFLTNCSEFYMSCNDGTCIHDSLVCDGHKHCEHGEDEDDCQHICSDQTNSCMSQCHHRDLCFCSVAYFQCLSGGCVPLHKLCDKKEHCDDASDEPPTCVYLMPEQLGHPSLSLDINNYINTLIEQNKAIRQGCLQSHNVLLFPVHNVSYVLLQKKCSPSSPLSDVKLFCHEELYKKHMYIHAYFYLDRLCIYDHDCDDNYIYHCLNGFHLLNCERVYCVGRFKCQSAYCISLDHICNKVCDCPHCEDESICTKLLCPGMVLIEQIGSGLRCSTKVAALKHSLNMRQVIHREGISITDDFPVLIHLENVVNLIIFLQQK